MILIVDLCRESLHYFEFVKPIEDVLERAEIETFTRQHCDVSEEDLERADKVIICGTSLKDNGFLNDLDKFSWLSDFDKPVLGICAGFQIIGMIFGEVNLLNAQNFSDEKFSLAHPNSEAFASGSKDLKSLDTKLLKHHLEIGFFHEGFDEEFLGFDDELEVYHLHNNYVDFSKIGSFDVYSSSKIPQAVKHKEREIYGVLFHPEVRQKGMIVNFARL